MNKTIISKDRKEYLRKDKKKKIFNFINTNINTCIFFRNMGNFS